MLKRIRRSERLDHRAAGVRPRNAQRHGRLVCSQKAMDVPTRNTQVTFTVHPIGHHVRVGAHQAHIVHQPFEHLVSFRGFDHFEAKATGTLTGTSRRNPRRL